MALELRIPLLSFPRSARRAYTQVSRRSDFFGHQCTVKNPIPSSLGTKGRQAFSKNNRDLLRIFKLVSKKSKAQVGKTLVSNDERGAWECLHRRSASNKKAYSQ
jgi:hypothetical protein